MNLMLPTMAAGGFGHHTALGSRDGSGPHVPGDERTHLGAPGS